MRDITVLKRDLSGEVAWQYEGRVLRREPNLVILEAFFNRDDMPFMDVTLKHNDRFVETFFTDRWYNIFEIYDRDTGEFKGTYCNIGHPAVIDGDVVSYIDLSLDLWISADGVQTVLDEDEFQEMPLDDGIRAKAQAALEELQERYRKISAPRSDEDGAG